MPIPSRPITLARFRWNLKNLPEDAATMAQQFVLREASEQETEDAVAIVQASYNLDPEWSGCALHVKGTVLPGVIKAMAKEPTCLFVQHGNRIIAASVYDASPEEGGENLVSGPCVLIEYRSRGIGGALLGATLATLRGRGLNEATGSTRPNSPSAKYLCTKFGGTAVPEDAPSPVVETAAD